MKQLFKVSFILMFAVMLMASDCSQEKPSADKSQSKATERSLAEANRQIGMPAVKNYQERKFAKMIFELRDQENLICYAYLVNVMSGEVGQYLGQCIGYGLPYAVQFTNPDKIVDVQDYGINSYQSNDGLVVAQADPNGLFMPTSSTATWLLLLDKEGKPHPVYVEPEIIVSPFPLK